jgi:hypothetical protein
LVIVHEVFASCFTQAFSSRSAAVPRDDGNARTSFSWIGMAVRPRTCVTPALPKASQEALVGGVYVSWASFHLFMPARRDAALFFRDVDLSASGRSPVH